QGHPLLLVRSPLPGASRCILEPDHAAGPRGARPPSLALHPGRGGCSPLIPPASGHEQELPEPPCGPLAPPMPTLAPAGFPAHYASARWPRLAQGVAPTSQARLRDRNPLGWRAPLRCGPAPGSDTLARGGSSVHRWQTAHWPLASSWQLATGPEPAPGMPVGPPPETGAQEQYDVAGPAA